MNVSGVVVEAADGVAGGVGLVWEGGLGGDKERVLAGFGRDGLVAKAC